MSAVVDKILSIVADIKGTPKGAYNIRVNGQSVGRASNDDVQIVSKPDGLGIEIHVKPGVKNAVAHIPVVVDGSGFEDKVLNDFYIGAGSEVRIVAGCGIHNTGTHRSSHDGIHTFHVGAGAVVHYTEKHYGDGEGTGKRILNPVTRVFLEENAQLNMESVQIEGVDDTDRVTEGTVGDHATLIVKEKLMTSGDQNAKTTFNVALSGVNSSVSLTSRSVAKGHSTQAFYSIIDGHNACAGHSECDALIMDEASIKAVPEITAHHPDASLIHEAAIGKIAGEQIIKLMTLGLTREQAEAEIVSGFLK